MANQTIRNEIVRASAGTGKTFQLSNRYLNLIVRGVDCPSILATTFTRKAAGEILDRIVQRLSAAALDDRIANELGEFIGLKNLPAARCRKILAAAMHQLHRLQISTLDSFFSRLARSFSLELGLFSDWRVVNSQEYEHELLRDEAIHRLLQQGAVNEVLHLLGRGEANRSISREIRQAVDNLYSIWLDSPAEAWRQIPEVKLLPDAEAVAITDELIAIEIDDKRTRNALAIDVTRFLEADFTGFITKGISGKVAAGETTYWKKEIPPPVCELLQRLISDVSNRELNLIARQTEANYQVLKAYDEIYTQLKSEHDIVEYDDIARSLAKFVSNASTGALGYRLDRRINHLLLDEFQDTSPIQWNAIGPFAVHVTAPNEAPPENLQAERSFFCVGDTKQAIYGWRGGEAEIFDTVDQQLPEVSEAAPLIASFRSSPVIIETVNNCFQNIPNHTNLDANAEPIRRWCDRFSEHSTRKQDLSGHVTLETAPEETETLEFAADRIAQAYRDIPDKSIGVLVRRNAAVGRLIAALARRGIPASEDSGNPLTDSAAVGLILSALRLADHPGNRIAWFHLQNSPLGRHFGFVTKSGKLLDRDPPAIADVAAGLRRKLLVDGFGETIRQMADQLLPACGRREHSRLMQLVDMAFNAPGESTLRPTDFAKYVESARVADPSAARVRVMNVHQAKGLEFDIVFLPEVDGRLMPQSPAWVSWKERPTEPISVVTRYMSEQLRRIAPDSVQKVFDTYREKTLNEMLCWLYVALTRSRQAMHVLIAPCKNNSPKTVSGLLRAALAPEAAATPGNVLYEAGDPNWHRVADSQSAIEQTSQPDCFATITRLNPETDIRLATNKVSRVRSRIAASPSELENVRDEDRPLSVGLGIGDVLGPGGSRFAADRGTLIHRWFEQIRWIDTEVPDQRLHEIAASMVDLRINLKQAKEDFQKYLRHEATQRLLSREFYNDFVGAESGNDKPVLQVFTERRFAVSTAHGIQSGTIDRLVLMYDGSTDSSIESGGKPVAADIVDFKTDAVKADDLKALKQRYQYYVPQQQAYRHAVAKLYELPLDQVSARLLFVSPGVMMAIKE